MKLLLDKLLAILRRDLLLNLRYGRGFWLLSITLLLEVAGFAFLSNSIGHDFRPEGMDYFLFLVAGTGIFGFFVACMNGMVSEVRDAQVSGSLEVLAASGTGPATYFCLSSLAAVLRQFLQLLFYIGIGLALASGRFVTVNWSATVLGFVLCLVMAVGLCLLAASVQVLIQKGGALVWFFGSVAWVLAGSMFSVESLPRSLRVAAEFFPIRYALDSIRGAMLKGSDWSYLLHPMGSLAISAIVLLLAGAAAFSFAVRHALRRGSLAFY